MKKLFQFVLAFLMGLFTQEAFATPSIELVGVTTGDSFALPNYSGLLYTANRKTTLLRLIGGINSGLYTPNKEYPTAQLYDLPASKQPAITEAQSIAGVTADHVVRSQQKNVVQIHQHAIDISYVKLANSGRLSGLNTNPAPEQVIEDEKAFQIDKKLKIVANDVNYILHNGVYQLAANTAQADKTRGLGEAIDSLGGVSIDAGAVALSKTILDSLFKAMFLNGANFEDMAILVNAGVKEQISDIYGFAPQDREIGGVAIKQIQTDYGNILVDLDSDVPTGELRCYDLAGLNVVFQTVPGKGNLFYETLAKTGASESGQLFGLIGFDHAPGFLHGKITNIAV